MGEDLREKPDVYWKERLTPAQYHILREKGTEVPFTGTLLATKDPGSYVCAACDALLFSSESKFDSGSGWPSFTAPAASESVELREDRSHGMRRVEARCARCGGHLGHVFDDGPARTASQSDAGGPAPTGKRYCINSLALDFRKSP